MKFIFTSYVSTFSVNQPDDWLKRLAFYTGILEALHHEHEVTGIERINYEGRRQRNGVEYYFTKQRKQVELFPTRLHQLVKQLTPDVVFINGFIFPFQVIQLRLLLGSSVKIIVLHRAERPFKGVKRLLQRIANHCVDAYLFSSAEFGKDWKKNISLQKIHEVMQASSVFTPVNKQEALSITGVQGDHVFLWVGRLDENKDPVTVATAFLRFEKKHPGASMYMIFQDDELLHEVKSLIGKERSDSIVLVGKIDHGDMGAWYNSADFIVSGSHYEGSGIAVCEAMSCGCIPVVTSIPSFKKMTGMGKCGVLFDPGDITSLLEALEVTNTMDKARERQKTLNHFNEELSFGAIARKINRIVASL